MQYWFQPRCLLKINWHLSWMNLITGCSHSFYWYFASKWFILIRFFLAKFIEIYIYLFVGYSSSLIDVHASKLVDMGCISSFHQWGLGSHLCHDFILSWFLLFIVKLVYDILFFARDFNYFTFFKSFGILLWSLTASSPIFLFIWINNSYLLSFTFPPFNRTLFRFGKSIIICKCIWSFVLLTKLMRIDWYCRLSYLHICSFT